jgi:hypothetical protein
LLLVLGALVCIFVAAEKSCHSAEEKKLMDEVSG